MQLQVAYDVLQSLLKQLAEPLQQVRRQIHGPAAVMLKHGLGWPVCQAGQFKGQQVSVPARTQQWSQRHQARAVRAWPLSFWTCAALPWLLSRSRVLQFAPKFDGQFGQLG